MIRADVIVGALWGDEGKGKVVGWVGRRYDAVMRVNASTNAGHCVSDGAKRYVTRQLPSVFFPERTRLVIAPGALLNLSALEEELRGRPDLAALRGKLSVASSVSLVIRPYIEKGQGGMSALLGSTHQGTGPSAVARTARHSLRLYDVQHAALDGEAASEAVLRKIERTCQETSPLRFTEGAPETGRYAREVLEELVRAYRGIAGAIGEFVVDYTHLVEELERRESAVLLEGCNGLLLDNLHGALPHVTSAPTNLAGMLSGANLSPASAGTLTVVMSAYSTCLGKRPFPTELTAAEAAHFLAGCDEIDPAEQIPRRLGWLDLPALRKALVGARGAVLHLNKLDVLSGLARIKVCTHYRIDGRELSVMPDDPWLLERAVAVYREVEGWAEPLASLRALGDLPRSAAAYVHLIGDSLQRPIASLGVGARNEDVIRVPLERT